MERDPSNIINNAAGLVCIITGLVSFVFWVIKPENLLRLKYSKYVFISVVFGYFGFLLGSCEDRVSWIGAWETNTATYQNLRVVFYQEGDRVIGIYPKSNDSTVVNGRIETKQIGHCIVGSWTETINGKRLDGQITLVQLPDQISFLGSYTRNWEGIKKQYVWTGLRETKKGR